MGSRLHAIKIAAEDTDAAAAFLGAVCGVAPVRTAGQVIVPIDDAALVVEPPRAPSQVGISGVEIHSGQGPPTSTSLHGLSVARHAMSGHEEVLADVVLDHVAVGVRDLETSAERWEAATGGSAELIGIHPASNGAFRAARLPIGKRMVELVTPVAGVDSALASRLERFGEGPVVLAMPAKNLDEKLAQLTELGIRVVRNDPHWLVHPTNPAHVLIQLTPRIQH